MAKALRKLRIAIDAHSVGAKLGGNESYAVNLIEALAQIDSANQYTLYVTTDEARERFQQSLAQLQSSLNTSAHTINQNSAHTQRRAAQKSS